MNLQRSTSKSLWMKREIRACVLLGALSVGLFVLLQLQTTAFGRGLLIAIFFLIFASIVVSVAAHTFKLGSSLRPAILRSVVRGLRMTRKMLHIPDGVKFLYLVAWLAFICSTLILVLASDAALYQVMSFVGFAIFVLGASLDLLFRVVKLMRKAWAKTLGKILSALFGTAVAISALILAKHQVHAITRVDPKYFDDFVNVYALVVAPVLYASIGIAALGAFAFLQLLGLVIFSTSRMFLNVFNFETIAPQLHQDCRVFWFRIRYGKRPVTLPRRPIFPIEDILHFMRPLGTVLVASLVATLIGGTLNIYTVRISDLTKHALVAIQYQSNSRCEGLVEGVRVVYLDRGNISTATPENGSYAFGLVPCKPPVAP